MPRYHFNTYDGHTTLDIEGSELSSHRVARRHAIRRAGILIESDVARLQLGEDWRMEVTDGQGRLLFRLDFTILEFRHQPALVDDRTADTERSHDCLHQGVIYDRSPDDEDVRRATL